MQSVIGHTHLNFGTKLAEKHHNKVETVLITITFLPGRVAQRVTCLATDACLTADPGVASLIPGPVPYFHRD